MIPPNVKQWNGAKRLVSIHYIIALDKEIKNLIYFKVKIGNTKVDLTSKRYTNGDEFEIYISIIK